jgi:hypothetical protein
MSDGTAKPVIFISYSHKDRAWLDYVRSFFAPLADYWTLQVWDDEKLRIGDDWRGDIYSAIDASRIFVLLVSRYALASEFIRTEEVGRILGRPKDEVQFCPIVVTPCYTRPLPWLDQPNRRPRDGKALSELQDPERDREMTIIARQIDEIVTLTANERAGASRNSLVTEALSPDHLAKLRSSTPVFSSAGRRVFPSIVDYGRLPETPYNILVGREAELRRLDDAWADDRTIIISLVAWGGAGKTSLVTEWLRNVRNDGYRNAAAVLCWSFYSQGTKERAASGEGFLDWALGKLKVKIDTTSSGTKGERLAEELSRRRVLLVLDGLESLQHGPEGQQGALKDQGLRVFLRGLAAKPPAADHSLVVLTSRLAVTDLRKWQDSGAPLIDLGRLSDEAGAALLRDGGVIGPAEALREAARDFAGHALALSLLAGLLRLLHGGDVGRRDAVRAVTADPNDAGHDQARRVIEAYAGEWLAREPVLLAIMYLIGQFDRPASADCMNSLRCKPIIDGLTDVIVDVTDEAWRSAIGRLREVRLLDPEDPFAPDALDAHPLLREWFGERLRQRNETGWKAAHARLYEHLRDTTKEGTSPTLESLAPLYQAITHGCRANRHQEALDEVYKARICRLLPEGDYEFYASSKLGAVDSDLAAISWFFEDAYRTPVAGLNAESRSWMLGEAGSTLKERGRIVEAQPAMRAALQMYVLRGDWRNAAIAVGIASEAELLIGNVAAAQVTADRSVAYADRSGDRYQMIARRAGFAAAMQAAGKHKAAAALFADAERQQQKFQPKHPLLLQGAGFHYCELLLSKGQWSAALKRATRTLQWVKRQNWLVLIALDRLTIGRAHLGLALENIASRRPASNRRDDGIAARTRLAAAVEGLREAALLSELPRGFLARAVFRRSIGDWKGAARDLDEVEEIAGPGPMKLFLCGAALERARLAFAEIEAFAPLNGRIGDGPQKPVTLAGAEVARLKEEAATFLAVASDYIDSCGYHNRAQELAELRAVLRGERRFADLPPRV